MDTLRAKRKSTDRHSTKVVNLRLREELRTALNQAADRHATSANDFVRRAIRELLEREGFWPQHPGPLPPPPSTTPRKS